MKSPVMDEFVRREKYEERELGARAELIPRLIPLGLMPTRELPDREVRALVGSLRARSLRDGIPLRSYGLMHDSDGEVGPVLLRRVLYGISCRNCETAAEAIPGAIGLPSATMSRAFLSASAAQYRGRGAGKREGDVISAWRRGRQQLGMGLIRAP